jgi:hypothetical protein
MVVPEVVVRALDGLVAATGRTAVDPDGASVEGTPDLNLGQRSRLGRTTPDTPNYRE